MNLQTAWNTTKQPYLWSCSDKIERNPGPNLKKTKLRIHPNHSKIRQTFHNGSSSLACGVLFFRASPIPVRYPSTPFIIINDAVVAITIIPGFEYNSEFKKIYYCSLKKVQLFSSYILSKFFWLCSSKEESKRTDNIV